MLICPNSGATAHSSGFRRLALAAGATIAAAGLYFANPKITEIPKQTTQSYTEVKKTNFAKIEPQEEEIMLSAACKKSDLQKLKQGDKFFFGIINSSNYGVEVTRISKNTVNVDISFNALAAQVENATLSLTFKLKNNTMPRDQIEALFRAYCGCGDDSISGLNEKDAELAVRGVEGISRIISNVGFHVSGDFLLFSVSGVDQVFNKARVVGLKEDEIYIEVNGKRFTVAREAIFNMKFISEKAGYLEMPVLLTSKKVDKKNRLAIVPDCETGRPMYMEVFMSEHACEDMRKTFECLK